MRRLALLLLIVTHSQNSSQTCWKQSPKPNIIVIIGDDLGHNDIGLRGSNQIPTPNIDALGYHGIILDKYYVQNSCTPSRAAFLTGNYPIRSGMQGMPIIAGENRSLPQDMPLLPQHLKRLGYNTHMVGKWHLGSSYRRHTPTQKGFDTHFGYWNGFLGYFDYYTDYNDTEIEGFDLHDGFRTAREYANQYATSVFTQKALDIIDTHNQTSPLFLVVNHLAAHAGRDGTELGVPNRTLTDQKYPYIADTRRRLYCDIVNLLDQSIGRIVKKLKQRKMLHNSIILFFSDNGAPTEFEYGNSGSNWPLRGLKTTNFEGSVRGTGVIFSPLFEKQRYVNKRLIHVSDWLPTFYSIAGGDLDDLGPLDGVNQWDTLSKNQPSARSEILVNIDELRNTTAYLSNNGRYKLVTGSSQNCTKDGYFGESGRSPQTPPYNILGILESDANAAIQDTTYSPLSLAQIIKTRSEIDLSWCRPDNYKPFLNCTDGCLFDLKIDPCETTNIIGEKPELAEIMLRRIRDYYQVLVPQGNGDIDPNANPQRYNNTWCTWLDDELCVKTPNNTQLV